MKATVGKLREKVDTLSDQMEEFFKRKRIETFDQTNWNQVRKVGNFGDHKRLEVTLELDPIPGSIEVYEGVLLMPEQDYHVDGRKVQFPVNSDTPENGLTIKYYRRVPGRQQ